MATSRWFARGAELRESHEGTEPRARFVSGTVDIGFGSAQSAWQNTTELVCFRN